MTASYPLISSICITDNRPALLQRAIDCFKLQNYPHKELVISYPFDDLDTKKVVEENLDSDLQLLAVARENDMSLGNARNQAIVKSHGDYICLWDDDDWYHSSRLSFQLNSIQDKGQGYQASILTQIFLYDAMAKEVYLSFPYTWEGTLLCKKEMLLHNKYTNNEKGEEMQIIKFLSSKKLLLQINDAPFLYIYTYHGQNAWNYEHFQFLLKRSELLNGPAKEKILELIEISV